MLDLYSRGLIDLKGAVPGLVRGLGHTAPTYVVGSRGRCPTAIVARTFPFELTRGVRLGMIISFDTCVDYGQIVVAQSGPATSVLWSDAHVAQGFAWAPTAVAFGVPDRDGLCRVEALLAADTVFDPADALWAVEVPFQVTSEGCATIGTVTDPRDVAIPAGHYALIFAAYAGVALGEGFAFRLALLFRLDARADFAILKAGDELTTDVVLRRDAEPV